MWPLIVAVECGGYFRRSVGVSPGKWVMKPLVRARLRVDKVGENKAAWAKATRSDGVAEPMEAIAEWHIEGVGAEVGRGKCHNRVSGVRWPMRTMASLTDTVTSVAVKAIVQPASQSWPMEMREEEARAGTM